MSLTYQCNSSRYQCSAPNSKLAWWLGSTSTYSTSGQHDSARKLLRWLVANVTWRPPGWPWSQPNICVCVCVFRHRQYSYTPSQRNWQWYYRLLICGGMSTNIIIFSGTFDQRYRQARYSLQHTHKLAPEYKFYKLLTGWEGTSSTTSYHELWQLTLWLFLNG